jgi:hypothetical protein
VWYGYNPTFHRFLDYGLVLSSQALYVCRRTWWTFVRWRRFALADIVAVRRIEGAMRPGLRIDTRARSITFYTPYDLYRDEMIFDRGVLDKALAAIKAAGPDIRIDAEIK